MTTSRNELLNEVKTSNAQPLPFTVSYNRTLPDLKITQKWHILRIEPKLKEIFTKPPTLAFKRNKNLRDMIGGNKVFDNKKILKQLNLPKENANHIYLIYAGNKLKLTQPSLSKDTFTIRRNVACKSSRVNYLVECCLFKKNQNVLETLNIAET